MTDLTPEAKAELAEAVRIVANSKLLKHIRNNSGTPPVPTPVPGPEPVIPPTGVPVPTPPPAKLPIGEPPKVKKRGLYWGDTTDSE
jgi:hypothetical protein